METELPYFAVKKLYMDMPKNQNKTQMENSFITEVYQNVMPHEEYEKF